MRTWILLMSFAAAGSSTSFVAASGVDPQRQFKYDAAESTGRRRSPPINEATEDDVLTPFKRSKVQANTRDLIRNFSITGWALRRHLDYVSSFDFFASNKGDKGLDRALEDYFYERAKAFTFDAAGRHGWASAIRMLEAQAMVYGDNGLVALDDGTWQGLASDRVRDSADVRKLSGRWIHGIKTNDAGRHLAYAVHTRTLGRYGIGGGMFTFERTLPAGNVFWHGYYDAWEQVRGISPIVAALNQFRDVYENFDYALMNICCNNSIILTGKRLGASAENTPFIGVRRYEAAVANNDTSQGCPKDHARSAAPLGSVVGHPSPKAAVNNAGLQVGSFAIGLDTRPVLASPTATVSPHRHTVAVSFPGKRSV